MHHLRSAAEQLISGSCARDADYCKLGAAAALPCPGGYHKNTSMTVMTSVDDCVMCVASEHLGTFAPLPRAD